MTEAPSPSGVLIKLSAPHPLDDPERAVCTLLLQYAATRGPQPPGGYSFPLSALSLSPAPDTDTLQKRLVRLTQVRATVQYFSSSAGNKHKLDASLLEFIHLDDRDPDNLIIEYGIPSGLRPLLPFLSQPGSLFHIH